MEDEEVIERLERAGWAALENVDAEEVLKLAAVLGNVGKVQNLKARESGQSSRWSLSSMHGRDEFPPHTDGASRSNPARFVALYSDHHYQAATLLFDGHSEDLASDAFSRSWLVESGVGSFYAVPRRRREGRVNWRLNPDFMHPIGDRNGGHEALKAFDTTEKLRIRWQPNLAVIWDNRRMLHSREAVKPDDGERALLRISVHQ